MAEAPKKFHTEADQTVYKLLGDIIKEHHKELGRTNFLILFKHGGWESKGRRILGRAKVVGEDMRSTFGKDAIIYINRDAWHYLSDAQKRYLLDHELYHLDIVKDKNYDTVELQDGRPKLTTVPHDLEDFVAIVQRHGIIMEDMKRLVRALDNAKQITIDDVAEEKKGLPPAQGSQEEDDPNQQTIEDVIEDADKKKLPFEPGDEEQEEDPDALP